MQLNPTLDPQLYRYCQEENSKIWRGPLTTEQYLEREKVLYSTEMCNASRNPSITEGVCYWIVRDESNQVLGSCETVTRKCMVIRFENDKLHSDLILSPALGSVFTFPNHRGKGVAHFIMEELHRQLLEKLGNGSFITLYSEVGDYYKRFGYRYFPTPLLKIKGFQDEFPKEAETLLYGSFASLVMTFSEKLVQRASDRVKKDHTTRILNLPTREMIDWFHARSRFISLTLYGATTERFGFRVGAGSFCIFTHDFQAKSLVVLMMSYEAECDLRVLIKALRAEAGRLGFGSVLAWENDVPRHLLDVEFDVEENPSLSAARFLADNQEFVWDEGNSKWAWF